jgi:hypothetical protein
MARKNATTASWGGWRNILSLSRAQPDDIIDCWLGGGEYVEMLRGLGVVKT